MPSAVIPSCRHGDGPSQRAPKFSRLHRLAEHETLNQIEADLARGDKIITRFHALGDCAGADAPRDVDNRAAQGPLQAVLRAAVDDLARDLELHDGKALETG